VIANVCGRRNSVAGQAHGDVFTRISLTPDMNFTPALQDHVITDEGGEDRIGPAM
jgi:hypothetical protein